MVNYNQKQQTQGIMKTKHQPARTSGKAVKRHGGPAPDRLKINGDWKAAVATALRKPKPPGGWPK